MKRLLLWTLILGFLGVLFGVGVFAVTAARLDSEGDFAVMESMRASRTTVLYAPGDCAREGLTPETYVPVEFEIVYDADNLVWVEAEEIPPQLKAAFVAIEDKRFYRHRGVDYFRTAHALVNYVLRYRPSFGGSTITQQLIKNVHGDKEVTLGRKVKEIIRAHRLEKRYTKDEILTYYLNIVPLGHGCMGVRAAARYYFGKEPYALSVAECATLAAITNAPARYEPQNHKEANLRRRNQILDAMADQGYLSPDRAQREKETDCVLSLTDPIFTGDRFHGWYTETVLREVIDRLAQRLDLSRQSATAMVYRGGLRIYTLADPAVQREMEKQLSHPLVTPDGREVEGSMVTLDPLTGDIVGIIGDMGKKTANRIFNPATDGYYPPGSAIKPLSLYAPALMRKEIHWGTVFEDCPDLVDGKLWPRNSPNHFMGRITVQEALARSKNTVAVTLYHRLGAERIYRILERDLCFSALTRGDRTDLAASPLALGQLTRGTTPLEMTAAFATFPSGGVYHKPRSFLAVYDAHGNLLLENLPESHRVWDKATAAIMTALLAGVTDHGTASPVTLKYELDTAGKTGTSGMDRDKWFVGYTPYFVTGFHCSMRDGTSLPAGCRYHLTVWDGVMRAIHAPILADPAPLRSFSMPDGVIREEYCLDSGCRPTDLCRADRRGPRVAVGYFTRDNRPTAECRDHVSVLYDVRENRYVKGEGEGAFSILSFPDRHRVEGVAYADDPYTLEYLNKLPAPITETHSAKRRKR